MEITTYSTKETKKLAKQIASNINKGDVLALYGDLGSGKTTFTKYLVEALGIFSRVQSPTFVIHRVYKNDDLKINHLDLYRLTSLEEVVDMGFEEMLEEDCVTVIEWPEVAEELLLKLGNKVKRIYFKYIDKDARLIQIDN